MEVGRKSAICSQTTTFGSATARKTRPAAPHFSTCRCNLTRCRVLALRRSGFQRWKAQCSRLSFSRLTPYCMELVWQSNGTPSRKRISRDKSLSAFSRDPVTNCRIYRASLVGQRRRNAITARTRQHRLAVLRGIPESQLQAVVESVITIRRMFLQNCPVVQSRSQAYCRMSPMPYPRIGFAGLPQPVRRLG